MANRGTLWDYEVIVAFVFLALCGSPLHRAHIMASEPSATATATAIVTKVEAQAGRGALLPCDAQPTRAGDRLLLVAWYRGDHPVYSFDTRESASTADWAEEAFAGRATWQGAPTPGLAISNVEAEDRAVYTCRVDFYTSPARSYRIALDVIEPPGPPVIFDEFGKEVTDVAGPYGEGISFRLICIVKGGYPTPRIQWLQNGTAVTSLGSKDSPPVSSGPRSLSLVVENATRGLLATEFTCTADNSLLVPPRRSSVRVDLYLKPLTIEMIGRDRPLSEGRAAQIVCQTEGSRPPATVTWFLGDEQINATNTRTVPNRTESTLEWTPTREHNGRVLTCKVHHPIFGGPGLERQLQLNVNYKPEVAIEMEAQTSEDLIAEGDRVSLICRVDASPPHYHLAWEHNGDAIERSSGLRVEGAELTIEKVSRPQAGEYACTASNAEGDARSSLHLRVNYRPLCQSGALKIASALQEAVTVVCQVDASPPPTTFEWSLSSPSGPITVDPMRYTIETTQGKSVLAFTPISESDYGTLSCRGSNRVGWQEAPCEFRLVPVSRPDPPSNCTVYNLTHDSLDLLCATGFEGGLQCAFVVEAWASDGLVLNASAASPHWRLRRLGARRPLRLRAYAANARGRSDPVALAVATRARRPPPPAKLGALEWTLSWSVAVGAGVIITVLTILCLALIASRFRQNSRDYEVNTFADEKNILQKENSVLEYGDDKHPHLINPTKGTLGTAPPPPYSALTSSAQVARHAAALSKDTAREDIHASHPFQNEPNARANRAPSERQIFTTKFPLVGPHKESRV